MTIAISIATYMRQDGKSNFFLRRCLDSISEQIHKDFIVYLYGDMYDDGDELRSIVNEYGNKFTIRMRNLAVPVERTRYPDGGLPLWRCGGSNCTNTIIDDAISDGLQYIAHLDHDDYWSPNHLYVLNAVIEAGNPAFIYTVSTYMGGILPNITVSESDTVNCIESYPSPSNVIHSSTCIDFSKIPFRYRDTFYETGVPDAADADMWRRSSEFMKQNNLKSYLINILTCFHDTENQ
jgi:hypothetical protein